MLAAGAGERGKASTGKEPWATKDQSFSPFGEASNPPPPDKDPTAKGSTFGTTKVSGQINLRSCDP